jgi:hypothetical protein
MKLQINKLKRITEMDTEDDEWEAYLANLDDEINNMSGSDKLAFYQLKQEAEEAEEIAFTFYSQYMLGEPTQRNSDKFKELEEEETSTRETFKEFVKKWPILIENFENLKYL